MKDKSIRDTAIITITLIGGLFLLQKCSGDETKIVKRDIKISQKEKDLQKQDTPKEEGKANSLIDGNYIKKDITHTVSIEKNNSNINTIKIVVSNIKDNNSTEVTESNTTTETKDSNDTEVTESNTTTETKDSNDTENIIDIPKIHNIEKIELPNIPKAPQAISSNIKVPVAIKAMDMEKAELNRAIEEREKTLKLSQIKINQLKSENQDLSIEIKKDNEKIHQLEEKINTALYKNDNLSNEVSKLKEELKFNQERREKALAQKAKLEGEIKKLKETIAKMIIVNQEEKAKESNEYNLSIQHLTYTQKQLEQNLSLELEKELSIMNDKTKLEDMVKSLEDKIIAQKNEKNHLIDRIGNLKATVAKMLTIAKEKGQEASSEYNATIQKFLSKEKNLEQNLSVELEKEKALTDEKAKLEDKVKSLEDNITSQIDEKNQLLTKISGFDAILKTKIAEVENEFNSKFEALKSQKASVEQNLSAELEKEKAIADEKAKLENMVKSLEQNITSQIDEKSKLSNKINELQATIDGFETTSKEKIAKVTEEFNSKFEALKSQKASVEQNLSAELEKEKALADKKAKLENMVKSLEQNITAQKDEKAKLANKIDELKSKINGFDTILKTKIAETANKFNTKIEALKSQKASIEQKLSAELEKEKAVIAEKSKLSGIVSLLETNVTTQTDEKSKLIAKVDELKTTIDSISKTAKEEKEKITQEFNTKLQELEAQKASIEENLTKQAEKLKEVIDTNSKLKEELIKEKANFEEQLKTKENEIANMNKEKEEAIKIEEAKQTLLKTFLLTDVQFKTNSSQLTNESKARLDKTAETMLEYPNFQYEIQGHTDRSGKEEYNIRLSKRRAEATKRYLVSKGVPEEILTTKGFGSSQPIADNSTREGRMQNRRVVFIIKD